MAAGGGESLMVGERTRSPVIKPRCSAPGQRPMTRLSSHSMAWRLALQVAVVGALVWGLHMDGGEVRARSSARTACSTLPS